MCSTSPRKPSQTLKYNFSSVSRVLCLSGTDRSFFCRCRAVCVSALSEVARPFRVSVVSLRNHLRVRKLQSSWKFHRTEEICKQWRSHRTLQRLATRRWRRSTLHRPHTRTGTASSSSACAPPSAKDDSSRGRSLKSSTVSATITVIT